MATSWYTPLILDHGVPLSNNMDIVARAYFKHNPNVKLPGFPISTNHKRKSQAPWTINWNRGLYQHLRHILMNKLKLDEAIIDDMMVGKLQIPHIAMITNMRSNATGDRTKEEKKFKEWGQRMHKASADDNDDPDDKEEQTDLKEEEPSADVEEEDEKVATQQKNEETSDDGDEEYTKKRRGTSDTGQETDNKPAKRRRLRSHHE